MQISIDDIKIKKRLRTDMGDLSALKDSLKRYGLLNPITVNSRNELIAGHRRLEAAKQLGWTSINVIVVNITDNVTLLELEIEENIQRQNFTTDELMKGYVSLEKLRNPGFFRRIWNAITAFFRRLFERD
ncbi:MAG: ParB N-terminal domain-containing protein [Spirochaetaceae bacterium]|jgi:ParB family chromosome partitioning protein|nr:ParB N-terminal domain-containing protein [Spirochaetaceae bacterium]